ncbi:MAG TPA: hypothetical protein DCF70_07675 [Treponema sp.]|nr:hypothetical protein [Treponema sp.]
MNSTVLFHRGNEYEWRFVGIWADMLDKSILDFDEENKKDFLVLFKEYDSPLQILQENLRLRNLYNQFKSNNSVVEIQKMEDNIKDEILNLKTKCEFTVYNREKNVLTKYVI